MPKSPVHPERDCPPDKVVSVVKCLDWLLESRGCITTLTAPCLPWRRCEEERQRVGGWSWS